MGFWSGFEGLTGHQPGAFKGFSLKDIIDKDMWERRERLNQGRRFEETGVKDTTAIYKGMAKPGLFGDVVGKPYGGGAGVTPVNPAAIVRESPRVDKTFPPFAEQHAEIMRNRYPRISQDTLRAARPWPNIQAQMLSDPLQGVGSMRIPTAELMGEKTTVKKTFADPSVSDTITETIKEKVPTGSAQWGNVQHPPNWQDRINPTSLMNILNPSAWQDVIRRKFEERQRARRLY